MARGDAINGLIFKNRLVLTEALITLYFTVRVVLCRINIDWNVNSGSNL
jgi:hypothetical protein